MWKWAFLFVGGGALLLLVFLLFFAFKAWNHERGFPKSILAENLKGSCVISRTRFVLTKRGGGSINEKLWRFLPIPEGRKYIYGAYEPGGLTDEDGADLVDLANAIEVPAGTRFILKDGFQNRDLNSSNYYFWLEPENIRLDSSFFYKPYGLEFNGPKDTAEIIHDRSEEMTRFPDNALFEKDCADNPIQ